MGNYVESNLGKNETITKAAERNSLFLLGTWAKGILLCWLLFIPVIKALIKTIQFYSIELAITNKRIIGKTGVVNTSSLDSPLNKIQNVAVKQPFFGKLFNYADVTITTAAGSYSFGAIKNAEAFKNMVLAQIDQYEEDRVKQQASEMASAMATVINK